MVETLQHPWELGQMLALFNRLDPRTILEIGCWEGGTLREWFGPGATVVAIDDQMRNGLDWRAQAAVHRTDLYLIQGLSQDPLVINRARLIAPYDWIFLDADHEYEAAKADWEVYSEMLAPGGVFVFHDIRPYAHGQVDRLWADIKSQPGRRTMEFHEIAADWGGIGVVFFP